jgi:beta-fructofuranosidase
MVRALVVGGIALFIVSINAQTTTDVSPAVPTGTPVPGNYSGPLRPQVHFSPPQDFMNDPNGMFVDANGTWHLYYQYNPTDVVAVCHMISSLIRLSFHSELEIRHRVKVVVSNS